MSDYEKASEAGLTRISRWVEGKPHHPMSERLVRFLVEHDFYDYGDHFCWKFGGDGDNGESLAYEMDAFFELLENESDKLITELDEAKQQLLTAQNLIQRYRNETPLGHQPHMIAHDADQWLAVQEERTGE